MNKVRTLVALSSGSVASQQARRLSRLQERKTPDLKSSRAGITIFCLALLTSFALANPSKAGVIVDPNFHAPFFATPATPGRVRLLPNGKFVVFFGVQSLTDQPTGAITRYLPDGTLDTSFQFTSDYDFVGAQGPGPNGTLIVSASRSVYGNSDGTQRILLLNPDGSIDPTFNPTAIASGTANPDGDPDASGNVRTISAQPDGKILLAGFFQDFAGAAHPGIVRLLANGAVDPGFAAVTLQLSGTQLGLWAKPAIQQDNKILIGGDFGGVNNVPSPGVARLNPDGSLDGTFQASGFTRNRPIRGIVAQADGKIVIGGRFNVGANLVPLVRLNSNGTLDPTYLLATGFFNNPSSGIKDLAVQSDGKIVAVTTSVYRFNTDGSLDSTFRQPALLVNRAPGGEAFTVEVQTDGSVLIGGGFTDVDDATGPPNGSRFGVARFNSNGTLDSLTTAHKTGFKTVPDTFARLPDGTTLISPNITDDAAAVIGASPAIPHNFGRLLPDGSLDPSFNPFANTDPNGPLTPDFVVEGFLRLADGKFLVGGTKGLSGGESGARLFPDLTVDPTFTPDATLISDPFPLPDGRLLVASRDPQTLVDGKLLRRLTINGTVDDSYQLSAQILADTVQRDVSNNITTVARGEEHAVLARFDDGSILLRYFATDSTLRLVRVTPDGALDPSFQSTSIPVTSDSSDVVVVDPQNPGAGPQTVTELDANEQVMRDAQVVSGGKVIVTGDFRSFRNTPARGIVRLNADGSVDPTFQTGGGAQWTQTTETATEFPIVNNVELQGDGKLLITGSFEAFNGIAAPGIASLNANGSVDTSFVPPAIRRKFNNHHTDLTREADGSFLLSGPYSLPSQTLAPSFIHLLGPPFITSPLVANGTKDYPFVYQFLATSATSLSASNLPPGLTLNQLLGAIVGTPTQTGTFQVGLTASNPAGTTNATLTITVQPPPSTLVITSSTSSTGRVGTPFRFQVITTGGSAATTVSASNLPAGLVLNASTGLISGTPAAEGSSAVTLTATDGGVTAAAVLQLSFTADPTVPVIISPNAASLTAGQTFTYTINAPAASDPSDVTIYTLIGTLPDGLFFDPQTGIISGTFTTGVNNKTRAPNRITLSGGIITNVQLFATNSHGTSTISLNFFLAPTGAVNIATRLVIGTGDNVLIAGFIITGNAPKRLIIRAIAPSLSAFGIGNALPDTTLELHDGEATLGKNDDWRESQEDEIIAANLAPTDNRESAILATLVPGNYTAIVAGKNTSGIAVVEVYDLGAASLDTSSNSKLANIATRGPVLGGDNVMIGGFIVSGQSSRFVVRAIGPSLAAFGIGGTLQDPTLALKNANGVTLVGNDDWQQGQPTEIQALGLAPSDPRESAFLATLGPGQYTAVVSGKANATGVALVEVYSLQ